jgi:hypothetical protein
MNALTDISCATATSCTALGHIADVGAFLAQSSNGAWSASNVTDAQGQQASVAEDLQCPALGQCNLVVFPASQPLTPYYGVYSQGGLSLIGQLPVPPDAYGTPWAPLSDYLVEAQACASSNWCVIAERYPTQPNSASDQGAFVTYTNGTLSVVAGPREPALTDFELSFSALVCPAQNACAAAGSGFGPAFVMTQP